MSVSLRKYLFLGLFLFLFACEEEYKAKDIEIPEMPRTQYSFEEFVAKFKEAELPFTLPEDQWYKEYAEVVGVEFYDTFIVGKLFGKKQNTAYSFYAKFKHPQLLPLILVEERETGSFFYLFTLHPNTYEVLDSNIIAFRRVSESELDVQTATIRPDFSITAIRNYTQTIVPANEADLIKLGIQTHKKQFSYKWVIQPDGKIEETR